MTNMTYAQALEIAINAIADETAKEKLEALKAQLAKRVSSKTPTKTQKENEGVMEQIVLALGELSKAVTVTELITEGDGLAGYTNQKISALLRKLVESGKVVKTIEGKKAMFSIA